MADAVGQHGVSTRITLGQAQQARPGDEGDSVFACAIKARNDGDALRAHGDEPMLRDLDSRSSGEGEGEDFARGDVPRVVRLGKLRDGKPAVGQTDRCLGPRAAKRRTSAKEEA